MKLSQAPDVRAPAKVRRWPATLAAAWIFVAAAATAQAATFVVEPTQIYLSGRTSSVLLTLRNDSTETLRFELSVFSWMQSPAGEMQLQPTSDIVFFPSLLTVGPGETRRVRVGSTGVADGQEKTYRIFIEELPPLDRQVSGVRVLTKMGVPIFVKPDKEVATATLSDLGVQNGALHFSLNNTGTVHFVPGQIRVRGLAGTTTVFEQPLDGWYVLAGGRREFDVAIPKADCARVTSMTVDVQLTPDVLRERLQTPNGACGR